MRSRIAIDKDKVPYQFQIQLGGKRYSMEIQYNMVGQFFTCTLYDANGSVLIYGEPLIYGKSVVFVFESRNNVSGNRPCAAG